MCTRLLTLTRRTLAQRRKLRIAKRDPLRSFLHGPLLQETVSTIIRIIKTVTVVSPSRIHS